jgi:hypothetical protein
VTRHDTQSNGAACARFPALCNDFPGPRGDRRCHRSTLTPKWSVHYAARRSLTIGRCTCPSVHSISTLNRAPGLSGVDKVLYSATTLKWPPFSSSAIKSPVPGRGGLAGSNLKVGCSSRRPPAGQGRHLKPAKEYRATGRFGRIGASLRKTPLWVNRQREFFC